MPHCDNTDHKGPHTDVQPVTMAEEYEGGDAYWCQKCRERDWKMMEDNQS